MRHFSLSPRVRLWYERNRDILRVGGAGALSVAVGSTNRAAAYPLENCRAIELLSRCRLLSGSALAAGEIGN